MQHLSDKTIRFLIWVLLILALYFLGSAFYLPAAAMLTPDKKDACMLRIQFGSNRGVVGSANGNVLPSTLCFHHAAITKELNAGMRGQADGSA